jgi:hypothetical protein
MFISLRVLMIMMSENVVFKSTCINTHICWLSTGFLLQEMCVYVLWCMDLQSLA